VKDFAWHLIHHIAGSKWKPHQLLYFLQLPVCADDGSLLGVLDVLDLMSACGGKDGWRSVFGRAIEIDDFSDTASVVSGASGLYSARHSVSVKASNPDTKGDHPVSKLRPKKPLIAVSSMSVSDVTRMLASKRGDSALVVDDSNTLSGVFTDVDCVRRVAAKFLDPDATNIMAVVTREPICVQMDDSAADSMAIMIENRFRHLPVLDHSGVCVGVLDIAKCLNNAIDRLEASVKKKASTAEDAVRQVVGQDAGSAQAQALQALLGQVMAQAFGNQTSPTLGSLLAGKPPMTVVAPETSIRDAAVLMATHRKACLVVEDDQVREGSYWNLHVERGQLR
jgi:CBS domain-containing protein